MHKLLTSHEAADAFWKHWEENHDRPGANGFYETTWQCLAKALEAAGYEVQSPEHQE